MYHIKYISQGFSRARPASRRDQGSISALRVTKVDIEVLAVLLQPLPLRTHPTVTLSDGGKPLSPPARGPRRPLSFANRGHRVGQRDPWQQAKVLDIAIEDPNRAARPPGNCVFRGIVSTDFTAS
jgi:hypothetical protein